MNGQTKIPTQQLKLIFGCSVNIWCNVVDNSLIGHFHFRHLPNRWALLKYLTRTIRRCSNKNDHSDGLPTWWSLCTVQDNNWTTFFRTLSWSQWSYQFVPNICRPQIISIIQNWGYKVYVGCNFSMFLYKMR